MALGYSPPTTPHHRTETLPKLTFFTPAPNPLKSFKLNISKPLILTFSTPLTTFHHLPRRNFVVESFNCNHYHDHHHHHHHDDSDGVKLTKNQEAFVKFAKAIKWTDLANFLRKHLELCGCSAVLFGVAAVCPWFVPNSAGKTLQHLLTVIAFPLVGACHARIAAPKTQLGWLMVERETKVKGLALGRRKTWPYRCCSIFWRPVKCSSQMGIGYCGRAQTLDTIPSQDRQDWFNF